MCLIDESTEVQGGKLINAEPHRRLLARQPGLPCLLPGGPRQISGMGMPGGVVGWEVAGDPGRN